MPACNPDLMRDGKRYTAASFLTGLKNVPEIRYTSVDNLANFIREFRTPEGNPDRIILVNNVTPEDFVQIERILESHPILGKVKCSYFRNERNLIVRVCPSLPHGTMWTLLMMLICENTIQQSGVSSLIPGGAFRFKFDGFNYVCDSLIICAGGGRRIPNVVIEAAYNQNFLAARIKAHIYFSGDEVDESEQFTSMNAGRLLPELDTHFVGSLAGKVDYYVRQLQDDSPFHREVNLVVLVSYEPNKPLIVEWWARSLSKPDKGLRVGVVVMERKEDGEIAVGVGNYNEIFLYPLQYIPPADWTRNRGHREPCLSIPIFFIIGSHARPNEDIHEIRILGRDFITYATKVYSMIDIYNAMILEEEGVSSTSFDSSSQLLGIDPGPSARPPSSPLRVTTQVPATEIPLGDNSVGPPIRRSTRIAKAKKKIRRSLAS
jgi:hypothetical protein